MKKIYKTFLAILLVSIYSCDNAIEIEQPGRLGDDSAFTSISDLRGGLLGAYNFLDTTYEIGLTASFTDEAYVGSENGGQNSALLNFNLNSGDGYVAGIWGSNYGAIGMANRVISAASSIDRSQDPTEYDNVLGQAYAIRAFSHFQLLTYFSTDYTDDNALAAILITQPTDDIFASAERNTNLQFYNQIEADLNQAESLITSDEGPTYMGLDFVNALRARMALYRGQYDIADAYAEDLLLNYPIANQTQFYSMFDDADFTEVIFSLERSVGDSYDGQGTAGGGWAGSLFAFIDPSISGGPFMEMSRSVYNEFNSGDIRFNRYLNVSESLIDPTYETNNNFLNDDQLLVFKYPGSNGQPLMNDLKVFRSAEMLLIRAEAAADGNDFIGAATFIKQLRDARFGSSQPLPVYNNQTEAFGAILDERRLEFLFEGHRWVDLKRIGDRGSRTIDRDARECSFLSGCTLPNSDYRFTLPIPLSETTANPVISQNPGY